jgi:hypothetical protein
LRSNPFLWNACVLQTNLFLRQGRLAAKSWWLRTQPAIKAVQAAASYLVRVTFGTALITSVLVVWMTIVAIMTSSSRDDNNRRCDRLEQVVRMCTRAAAPSCGACITVRSRDFIPTAQSIFLMSVTCIDPPRGRPLFLKKTCLMGSALRGLVHRHVCMLTPMGHVYHRLLVRHAVTGVHHLLLKILQT